jgi:hypothetical protein
MSAKEVKFSTEAHDRMLWGVPATPGTAGAGF